jgi:hypothetical protein
MATEANLAALPVHSVLINIPTSEIEDYSYKDITGDVSHYIRTMVRILLIIKSYYRLYAL